MVLRGIDAPCAASANGPLQAEAAFQRDFLRR
jgi:hypothetical protein